VDWLGKKEPKQIEVRKEEEKKRLAPSEKPQSNGGAPDCQKVETVTAEKRVLAECDWRGPEQSENSGAGPGGAGNIRKAMKEL